MRIVDVNQQPSEEWRSGVTTRMRASAANSAKQLCMFEQWCDPGHGAPSHLHAVEEVLCVREGQADVWIDDEHVTLTAGQLVIVPAGRKHGFSNVGETVLHIESTLRRARFRGGLRRQT
jgi:mannose-6-phosphate isomerase-like protein (cupin superfamily)